MAMGGSRMVEKSAEYKGRKGDGAENSEINERIFKTHVKAKIDKLIEEWEENQLSERQLFNFRLYDDDYSTTFILNTRRKADTLIEYGNDDDLYKSDFDNTKHVKIIVHGWTFFTHSLEIQDELKNAFLQHEDVNVIFADWTKRSNTLYTFAVKNTEYVGAEIGRFVDWLVSRGTPLNSFHLIGFSLGAHVVGIAGRSIKSGHIPYITALDPAGPKWNSNPNKLVASDAVYVEVIHTDIGCLGLGFKEPIGNADFYPNKGYRQPGCGLKTACSHTRSYKLFARTIGNKNFMASQCNDYLEMFYGNCANLSRVAMGGSKPKYV
ncbi:pancreatic lipase-related protein 2-like [Arctopsyche grandis]|uniref:pancreatic lipase-related protein 2-like n=1 Tax=Arctopsyche grandis TaxID=121162 RepID=UPI00406D7727